MSLDRVTTSQRMTLEAAVQEYVDAGATPTEITEEVESFIDDYLDDVE